MQRERCASAALATVYRISHKFIMNVESSKKKKKKLISYAIFKCKREFNFDFCFSM